METNKQCIALNWKPDTRKEHFMRLAVSYSVTFRNNNVFLHFFLNNSYEITSTLALILIANESVGMCPHERYLERYDFVSEIIEGKAIRKFVSCFL